jgi:hypothetical protein
MAGERHPSTTSTAILWGLIAIIVVVGSFVFAGVLHFLSGGG